MIKYSLLNSVFKRIYFSLLITVLVIPAFFAQTTEITFTIKTVALDSTETVYITGSHQLLGNWKPDAVPFNRISDSCWQRSFSFPSPDKIEYKITRGSWGTEARYHKDEVPDNSTLTFDKDTSIVIRVPFWSDQFVEPLRLSLTGNVHYHRDLTYGDLTPRDVIVWLPPGYEENAEKHYPVIYMQDGQNIFDPATAAFGVDWQMDETADSLIRTGIIEPVIIAGIYNTDERMEEYLPTEKGRIYMRFIVDKVKPLVDSCYRTIPDAEHTAVGGSSAGGLISFMLSVEYPDIFTMAACLSPAIKYKAIDYVSFADTLSPFPENLRFFFSIGGDELDMRLKPGLEETITLLEKRDYERKIDYIYIFDENGTHSESYWAQITDDFLIYFFDR